MKFGIQRRRVLVALVAVAAGGVGLPDLDQLARHRPARLVEQPSGHDDPLPDRLTGVAGGEVGVERVDVLAAEAGRPAFDLLGVDDQRRMLRVTQGAAAVRRVVEPRLGFFPTGAPVLGGARIATGDLRGDVGLRSDALGVHEA